MLLAGNGTVLTFDETMTRIENGCVAVEGGIITAVGDTKALRSRYPEAEFLDARGRFILPGLINAHHHIYSAFARGMNLGGPAPRGFLDVLEGLWWRMDKALTLEDITLSAYVTLIDSIRNGVTTVFDHHASPGAVEGSLFAIGEVVKALGLRASLSLEVSDRDGLAIADAQIEENTAWLKACREMKDERLRGLFGLHASFTLGDRTLERCAALAAPSDGFHVHVAEGSLDARDAMDTYHLKVLERLDRFSALRDNTIAVHCIAVTDEEIDLAAARGTFVAHNPQSNMNNAVGTARVLDMARRGVSVCLGTDGYTSDVLESYKLAPILQRHALENPSAGFSEATDMLTKANAALATRAFGRSLGMLKEGAFGDLIIVDYDPPTPVLDENQAGHILFGLTGRMVDTVVVGGRTLMRDRRMQTVDAAAVYARAREAAARLWKRL